jgi:electron transport complex protein RnfG
MKKEYFKMMTVLSLIAAVCGFLLSTVRDITAPEIEKQVLIHVKAPALNGVLKDSDNDLLEDKMDLEIEGQKVRVFLGKQKEEIWALAYESSASGFMGDVGVMVGFNIKNDSLTAVRILTHQETPGLGARISEPEFTMLFSGKKIAQPLKVKKDGGSIDAVSGATNSSRAVCTAVENCKKIYQQIKRAVLKESK